MPEFRFHHLERRRLDSALPDMLEAALAEGRSVVVQTQSVEARDYLAASKERGDAYIAGKTERHEPGGVTVATIFTEIDRGFVIVVEN